MFIVCVCVCKACGYGKNTVALNNNHRHDCITFGRISVVCHTDARSSFFFPLFLFFYIYLCQFGHLRVKLKSVNFMFVIFNM